ncbi:HAMP domain-containing sensor histidine kinase [Nocardioides mesophilus]|uniref:Signal transduction histidine-protein kinase/phosphatase MprB n=1 Tax=Nocardioides mesophilus TaxID=433659 RepID=A0A7G9R7C0_9ACTN|nr:ATP-binding protein [Nocardioides mesophilus]QNN51495.1 HAMP domain-containing protein [Nocardioides mesophilus]
MRPLDPLRSIKTKLGVLVAVTVAVAAALASAGTDAGLSPLLTVPVAVAAALAVTQLLARGMTSPLREMTAAAKEMAGGQHGHRVTATSRDEVGELARAFNTMAAELEAVDRQRRELVANVSHELRTPVSALRAVLENLVDGVAAPDPATLRAALAQTERLSGLVGDLLDLSRVDAGIAPLRPEPLPVRPLLEEAVAEAELLERAVRYVVAAPDDLVVTADRARLQQLLANLLDNAGRHSPPQGTVRVSGTRCGTATLIEVADDGPGIAPADRARVFERFDTAGPDDTGGTGLGLAIARWVTQLHGGSIAVADGPAPPAGGCRIRATFPDVPHTT